MLLRSSYLPLTSRYVTSVAKPVSILSSSCNYVDLKKQFWLQITAPSHLTAAVSVQLHHELQGTDGAKCYLFLPGEVSPKSLLSPGASCQPGLAQERKWGCSVTEEASDPNSVMRAAMRVHCASSPSTDRFCWVHTCKKKTLACCFSVEIMPHILCRPVCLATRFIICWEQAGRQGCKSLAVSLGFMWTLLRLVGTQTEVGFQALLHIF